MGNLRFGLIAAAAFAAAFVGISWAARGFPLMTVGATPLKPDARIPTFAQSVKAGIRKDWTNSKTSQSDGDKERDALRLAALQAANAYSLSPCDKTLKQNLVEAMSAYAKAWASKAGCSYGSCGGDDRRIDAAAAAFSSPADMRVREAVEKAFGQGGVSIQDFPAAIRIWVAAIARDRGDPQSACDTGTRADNVPAGPGTLRRMFRARPR